MNAEFFLEAINEIDDKYIEEARCYKIKKKISIKKILAAAACVALIVGMIPLVKYIQNNAAPTQPQIIQLGVNGEFTVLEVNDGDYTGRLNANHKSEFGAISSTYDVVVDESRVDEYKEAEFCGRTWYGFYKDTRNSNYYNDNADRYVNSILGVRFEINTTTGKCTSFFISSKHSSGKDVVLSREECLEKTTDFLKEYLNLTDIGQYKLTFEKYRGGNLGYQFMFSLMSGEFQTSERVTVGVRENGEIFSYAYHSLDSMKNIDTSNINRETLLDAIDAKMETIYGDFLSCKYDVQKIEVVRLSDGSCVLDCEVAAEIRRVETKSTYNELCHFIIKIS